MSAPQVYLKASMGGYNPHVVEVAQGEFREVESINLFDATEVKYHTRWFGHIMESGMYNSNAGLVNHVKMIDHKIVFDIPLKRKIKVDLSEKDAFYVPYKPTYSFERNDKKVVLYIPLIPGKVDVTEISREATSYSTYTDDYTVFMVNGLKYAAFDMHLNQRVTARNTKYMEMCKYIDDFPMWAMQNKVGINAEKIKEVIGYIRPDNYDALKQYLDGYISIVKELDAMDKEG